MKETKKKSEMSAVGTIEGIPLLCWVADSTTLRSDGMSAR